MRYVAGVLEVGKSHDSEGVTYSFLNMTILQPSSMMENALKVTNYWLIMLLPLRRDVEQTDNK
jgi:hypothetical protein